MSNSESALVKTEIVELEIASPAAIAKHAASELSAPIDRATSLFAPFAQPFAAAAELLLQEASASTAQTARALRLKLVKARTEIGRTKDAAKADVKLVGQVIDWYHRKGAQQCEEAEARLLEIEKAEERAEAARKEAIRVSRHAELAAVGVDGQFYQLAEMPSDAYGQLLANSTTAHQARLAAEAKAREEARVATEREEAERMAREQAMAEERERIRVENERLKLEAAKREAEAKIERDRLAAEAKEREVELQAERERVAKEKAEMEARAAAEQKAAALALQKEREAREKVEAQARARELAEANRLREEAEAMAREAAAPDREKLLKFSALIRTLEVPEMKTSSGKSAALEIQALIEYVARQIDGIAVNVGTRKETKR